MIAATLRRYFAIATDFRADTDATAISLMPFAVSSFLR